MTLRIERTDTPTDEERQAILAPLRAYNTAKTGGTVPELVAWLVRDEQDEIVGGSMAECFSAGCISSCWWCRNRPGARARARP